ncbi:DMT family transporter [Tenuifilum thalassicum]|uniref:DMT family transporter n=1 Tax=Tenuifilum thalassicum TaxID=2590900 RepID=A0A7D3XJS4_9BACT|nr:DMT family transporter [Tenuifilum thalassicum]QKG78835.1 DMT family transporter [Tenuifilum thalassicum]
MSHYYGELAALLTAFFWTATAIAFESASKKVGSLSVNLLRLGVAFIFLSVYAWISRGIAFPVDAGKHQWIWLSLSGLVGFVLGDLFLFQAYVLIGSRISMLIMSLAPPLAAIIGWLALGETLTAKQTIAMIVVLGGIVMVVLERQSSDDNGNGRRMKFSYPIAGILLAFGGALGQAGGLVLSKYGMADYDVIPSVQIRVITGIIGFTVFFGITRRWSNLAAAIRNGKAMKRLLVGAFFGPFLGVSFSLLAVKYTSTGVASALMSIVPVLIIAPAVIIFKEKITLKEVIGAVVTVIGVGIFFL